MTHDEMIERARKFADRLAAASPAELPDLADDTKQRIIALGTMILNLSQASQSRLIATFTHELMIRVLNPERSVKDTLMELVTDVRTN